MSKVLGWLLGLAIAAPFAFGLTIVAALMEAVAFVKLNEWFVVPIFHTPLFGYWQAAGLAMLFGLLCTHADQATEVEGPEIWKRALRSWMRPWIVLGFGYCFKVWAS